MSERCQLDRDAYEARCQTGPCFICEIVAGKSDSPDHIIYQDGMFIAFLDKYPRVYGHTLVATRMHREQVTGDYSLEEYLELQRMVYRVAEAVRQEVDAERVYLLSLGSQQGNSHVHWHIVPLPHGVPYREQQLGVFRQGILKLSEQEQSSLAARIRQRITH